MRRTVFVAFVLSVLAAGGLVRNRPAPAVRKPEPLEPMSCYRVSEEEAPQGVDFRGAGYRAEVRPEGIRMEGHDTWIRTSDLRIRQGGAEVTGPAVVRHPSFARAEIDRGAVVEEYRFENRRVEQLFHLARPIGAGPLRLSFRVETNLTGAVEEVSRSSGGWKGTPLEKGGLNFTDAAGNRRASYSDAVAVDASGNSVPLDPHFEDGEVVLCVSEAFLAAAAFPVTVDPWFDLNYSAATGGISANSFNSDNASLALDANGNPVVAWGQNESGADSEIYVKRFNGTAWVELAGSASTGGISAGSVNSVSPSLALDGSGNPVVAWIEQEAGDTEIYVKRFNGTSWVELAGSASTGGISAGSVTSQSASLKVDGTGNPIVAWEEWVGSDSEIYVKRFDGTAWVELAGSASTEGISAGSFSSASPSLALDGAGNPVVAWVEGETGSSPNNDREVYVKRFSGSAWVELAGSASTGGISAGLFVSEYPSLALDGVGNPVVAWQEEETGSSPNNDHEIYVKRFSGSAWVELAGSGSTGGISAGTVFSTNPSLAVDANGNAIVAWTDWESSDLEVYVKRFNGTSWVDFAGSASTGGMSAGPVLSALPSLALEATGNPVVAWGEQEPGDSEIYVRRWYQNSPAVLKQFHTNGSTAILTGDLTSEATVILRGTVTSDLSGVTVRLQVEVQPIGTSFTGIPNGESGLASSGTEVSVTIDGLSKGSKHWRARVVDSLGQRSQWVSYGGNADGTTDFAVQEFTVTATSTTSTADDGSCGLMGIEMLFLLLLLRRNRRKA